MSKIQKVKLSDALRADCLTFRNECGRYIISNEATKALFGYIVDNRFLIADRLDKYDQLKAEIERLKSFIKDNSAALATAGVSAKKFLESEGE